MKKTLLTIALLTGGFSFAQNNITTSATDAWTGYMNWFDLSEIYITGEAWQVPDLQTTLVMSPTEDQVVLQPNFNLYGDGTDAYWVDQTTGEGAKIMEASTYVEPGATFNGQDLTFTGNVVSNTLDAAYQATCFIKALDPANNYQDVLNGAYVLDLPASGDFTISVTGAELATGLIVQYGFSVKGVNANPANEVALGNVTIEGSSLGLSEKKIQEVAVYPNPAISTLNIPDSKGFENYSISSVEGKVVLSGNLNTQTVNIENLENGNYVITFEGKNGSEGTARFIKK